MGDQTTRGTCRDQLNSYARSEADFEHAIVGLHLEKVDEPAVIICAFGNHRSSDTSEPSGGSRKLLENGRIRSGGFSAASGVRGPSIVVIN
jgi:hypothetical protein